MRKVIRHIAKAFGMQLLVMQCLGKPLVSFVILFVMFDIHIPTINQ
jgi:hypothetical protein